MNIPRDEWAVLVLLAGIPLVLAIDYHTHKKRAAEKSRLLGLAPEDVEPFPFRQHLFMVLLTAFWLYGLIGPLFVPSDALRATGLGMSLAADIWVTLWALQRYRSGKWREVPKMTPGKAKFGVLCVPLVMFFIFWGAIVSTGGGVYTRLTGSPDTLQLAVSRYHYHDKFGDHYCLAAPAFRPAYLFDIFDNFCGLEQDEFDALPDHFPATFTLRRSPLGFIVESYKRD